MFESQQRMPSVGFTTGVPGKEQDPPVDGIAHTVKFDGGAVVVAGGAVVVAGGAVVVEVVGDDVVEVAGGPVVVEVVDDDVVEVVDDDVVEVVDDDVVVGGGVVVVGVVVFGGSTGHSAPELT